MLNENIKNLRKQKKSPKRKTGSGVECVEGGNWNKKGERGSFP